MVDEDLQRILDNAKRKVISGHTFLFFNGDLYESKEFILKEIEEQEVEAYLFRELKNELQNEGKQKEYIPKILDKLLTKNIITTFTDNIKRENFLHSEEVKKHIKSDLIAFKNGYVDIHKYKVSGLLELEHYDIIMSLKDENTPHFFQQIPHSINVDTLKNINDKNITPDEILAKYSPRIHKFFIDLLGFDRINILIGVVGYCFYRENPYKKMFIHYGSTNSGRTTFFNLLIHTIGLENTFTATPQELADNDFMVANLHNKLLNAGADIPNSIIYNLSMLKKITGEDIITANRKFKEAIQFKNHAKANFSANRLPQLKDKTDEAYYGRLTIISYYNSFPTNDGFASELFDKNNEQEIEGLILAGLVMLRSMLINGIDFMKGPEDVADYYRRETDSIYAFITSSKMNKIIVIDDKLNVLQDKFYERYTEFVANEMNEDVKVETKTFFTQELARQYRINADRIMVNGKRIRVYKGAGFINENATPQGPQVEL